MVAATVPAVYASALLELADERSSRGEVVSDAAAVAETLDANPQLLGALASPDLTREQGKKLLHDVFAERVSRELLDFLLLAVDRERVEGLPAILDEVGRLAAEQEGREQIAVTTAVELDAANRERLERLLRERRGANVEISYHVDPAIIGGLRVQSAERVVDFTARRHLAEMKRTMLQAPVDAAWAED